MADTEALLRSIPAGQLDEYERSLFARVEQWTPMPRLSELSQPRLAELAGRNGTDFATALLYRCLRQSPVHGAGIAALDETAAEPREAFLAGSRPCVAIVPGGCHDESADSRAALQLVHDEVIRNGLPAEVIPVRTFGLLPEQAEIIAGWLDSRHEAEIILVSLSKGTAEVKLALRHHAPAFDAVSAWVDISGLLYGSEWVRWLLDRNLSCWSARVWCWYWGYPFAALEQLRRGPGSLLDFDIRAPAHLRMIHIVGLPLTNRLSHPYTRRSFARLSSLGPNDGMGIMGGDLVRFPGLIYPVWGADHFLRSRSFDLREFVSRVLRYLAGSHVRQWPDGTTEPPRSGGRSRP